MKKHKSTQCFGWRKLLVAALFCTGIRAGTVQAAEGINTDVEKMLKSISSYVRGIKAFSVNTDIIMQRALATLCLLIGIALFSASSFCADLDAPTSVEQAVEKLAEQFHFPFLVWRETLVAPCGDSIGTTARAIAFL